MYKAALSGTSSKSRFDRGGRGLTGEDPICDFASTTVQPVHHQTVSGHHHPIYPLNTDVGGLAVLVVFGDTTESRPELGVETGRDGIETGSG